jgi:hypothetical protein
MRTTIDIDSHLLKRLRDEAHRRNVPFKDLLTSVIRRGLEEKPAARGRYRLPTHSLGQVREGINLDKALQLADDLADEETAGKVRRRK